MEAIPLPIMDLEKGWAIIQDGIDKVVSFVDVDGLNPDDYKLCWITSTDYMNIWTTIHMLCTYHKDKSRNKLELYSRCKTFCQRYVHIKVLPALRGQNRSEPMLREVVKRWCDYRTVTRLVSEFFCHSEKRSDSSNSSLYFPTLFRHTALLVFQHQIREDRDGNTTDHRALVKKVLETVYDLESQMSRVSYQIDFEPALLSSSCAYYCTKFKHWSHTLASQEYISQVNECINAERSRAEQFLYPCTMNKLLEVIISNVQNKQHDRGTCDLVRAIGGLILTDDVDMC